MVISLFSLLWFGATTCSVADGDGRIPRPLLRTADSARLVPFDPCGVSHSGLISVCELRDCDDQFLTHARDGCASAPNFSLSLYMLQTGHLLLFQGELHELGNHIVNRANFDAHWSHSKLVTQSELGLRTQRRRGIDPDHRAHPGAAEIHLGCNANCWFATQADRLRFYAGAP